MEYRNTYNLADTYPDPTKYSSKRVKNMRLTGKYVETNYIDFDIPTVEDITVVPGTTFRFVLVVKDSLADDEPKYFVSDSFYNDIELSQIESNPYFIRAALKDIFSVTITLDDFLTSFENFKTLDIAAGVKTYKNLFIVPDDNTIGGIITDYEGLVRYVDWVVSPINANDQINGGDGVLPTSKIAEYDIGQYDKDTGEFVSRAEQKLRNKLEDLYDELQAINDTLDQISSEIREPQKKKTTVLEGIMLGLSVVSLVGGVGGLSKQFKATKAFNADIGATKEAAKQSKNVQKLAKTATPVTMDKVTLKAPSAPQSLPAGVPKSITSASSGVTYNLSDGIKSGKTIGQSVKGAAKSVVGGVKEANKAISKVTDFAGGIIQSGLKKIGEKVVTAVVSAISKKAAGMALKLVSGPVGIIAAATVGIVKFFVSKAEEKKRFTAEKKEYSITINQIERLHQRKANIENEIDGILSGKITLDVPPLNDTKLTATQRYLQRYGKSILDRIVVSGS